MPPTDCSKLDLATINAAQSVIVASIRHQCCQWEQESADAIGDGRISNALMLEHWSFAADLLAHQVATTFTALFAQTLDAQLNRGTTTRSIQDLLVDAMTLEVVAAQSESVEVLSA
jgi:hypothetical protein